MATETGPYPLGAVYLTSAEAWNYLGVQPSLLRQWVTRGHVVKSGRDSYDMGSLMNLMKERGTLSEWIGEEK